MRLDGRNIEQVQLLKKSTTKDSHNFDVVTWNVDTDNVATDDNGNIFAEWWDQGGKEGLEQGQVIAYKDVRCKIYHISGLNESEYAIQKGDVFYDIENIKEIHGKEGMILMLQEQDNEQSI